MTTYFFVAASEKFLTVEEPLDEILKERMRNYKENNKEYLNTGFKQYNQVLDKYRGTNFVDWYPEYRKWWESIV